MLFDWDEAKNRSNVRKHGLAFEEAIILFDDPYHISVRDRIENGEERWQSYGLIGSNLVMAAHTWVEDDGLEAIRIIMAAI